jgi:hypothetical protein
MKNLDIILEKMYNTLGNSYLTKNFDTEPFEFKVNVRKGTYDNDLQKEYRDIKRLLRKFKLKSIVEYNQLATQKMILPINPKSYFGTIFKGWIDYLSIKREYFYDINTFREKCSEYAHIENLKSSETFIDYEEIYEKIHILDNKLPNKDILLDLYQCESYKVLFENIFVKKKKVIF